MVRICFLIAGLIILALDGPTTATAASVKENNTQVETWNAFANSLVAIHRHWEKTRNVKQSVRIGGYSRMPDFYREVTMTDQVTGLMLSRVKLERENPENVHSIDVFFYDDKGRVTVDYTATYLTDFRNAPIQALVNLHAYNGDLWAFRQFSASGERMFERCEGTYFDEPVEIWRDEGDILVGDDNIREDFYLTCFSSLPLTGNTYLDPKNLVPEIQKLAQQEKESKAADADFHDKTERRIQELSMQIDIAPKNAGPYFERGNALFLLHRFDESIDDFTRAIQLDDTLDKAYFGRGMALGRAGRLNEAIADFGVFIRRHPDSSIAYTKRGVRHIWNRDFKNAEKDLTRAVELDNNNAEAHDDLGVVLAQSGRLEKALEHFLKARAINPGYQKVHHNLAMVYFIADDLKSALASADAALDLNPDTRGTLTLKAEILDAMGLKEQAQSIRERAEFLPESLGPSERSTIQ